MEWFKAIRWGDVHIAPVKTSRDGTRTLMVTTNFHTLTVQVSPKGNAIKVWLDDDEVL